MIKKVRLPLGTTRNVTVVSVQSSLFAVKDESVPPEGYIILSEQKVSPGEKGYVVLENSINGPRWKYYPKTDVN